MLRSREFSRKIRELAEPLNLKQAKLGELWGVTQSYAGQILRGDAAPSRDVVERIIEVHALPREEWLGYAGYGPKATVAATESVEAAAAMLAASGARFVTGFGAVLQRITGLNADELAAVVPEGTAYVAAVYEGWVPAEGSLVLWAYELDLTAEQTTELLIAGGYGPWRPVDFFGRTADFISEPWSWKPTVVQANFDNDAPWARPRLIYEWLEIARKHFIEGHKQGFDDGYWLIKTPDHPDGPLMITYTRERPGSEWAHLESGRTALNSWSVIVAAVCALARLCDERDEAIPFDFRRLQDCSTIADAGKLAAAVRRELARESEPAQ
jgi:transcriptional regulator with XRE-family HTH domain